MQGSCMQAVIFDSMDELIQKLIGEILEYEYNGAMPLNKDSLP